MNILPAKHVRKAESIVGIGAVILRLLRDEPKSFDMIWKSLRVEPGIKERINGALEIDSMVLSINFLYLIGALELAPDGRLKRCD